MGDSRFTIPPALLKVFSQEPRVVFKDRPDGIWPVDPIMLQKADWLQKLAADKEFNAKFEIVIMPR